MTKPLKSNEKRSGAAYRLLIAVAFVGFLSLGAGEAFAFGCERSASGSPGDMHCDPFSVDCASPEAVCCIAQVGEEAECTGLGFSIPEFSGPPSSWCANADCTQSPNGAPVPELSAAAVAVFLGLALLIGWRVRRSFRPAS